MENLNVFLLLLGVIIVAMAVYKQQSPRENQDGAPGTPGGPPSAAKLGDAEPPNPDTPTLPASWQTKAPKEQTTRPAIGTTSYDPLKPWQQPPNKWYGTADKPVYQDPMEHPYNPKYPPNWPSGDTNTSGGEPVVSTAQKTAFWDRYITPGYKPSLSTQSQSTTRAPPTTSAPTTTAAPQEQNGTTAPPGTPGTLPADPYDVPIPTTPAPTPANIMAISEEEKLCPAVPPTGKLELAIKAWTAGRRTGVQNFDVGSVDMGRDGGWFDAENKGCCDHYCRMVKHGWEGSEYWSCIAPQAPNSEFAAMRISGKRCTMFGGNPPADRAPQ